MGKKKFIESGKGTTYRLVHRSQLDKAAAEGDEGDASEFVLVPAGEIKQRRIATRRNGGTNAQHGSGGGGARYTVAREHINAFAQHGSGDGGARYAGVRDHINAFGLPDDGTGYDYESHLKTMGGGTFINKEGRVGSVPLPGDAREGRRAVLPAESLPAEEGEVARNLAAITISDKVMDDDMRAIITGESLPAEEGEVARNLAAITISDKVMDDDMRATITGEVEEFDELEVEEFDELEDDFVLQAAGDGGDDDGGFDFDAHIARLIAASEREVGLRPRGADDDFSGSDGELDDPSEFSTPSESGSYSGDAPTADAAAAALLAAQFEATLAEYDSDTWGEGGGDGDAAEGEEEGEDEGEGDEGEGEGGAQIGALADAYMDEFLREQADLNWFAGLGRRTADVPRVWQGERATQGEDGSGGSSSSAQQHRQEGEHGASAGAEAEAAAQAPCGLSGPRLGSLRGLNSRGGTGGGGAEGAEGGSEGAGGAGAAAAAAAAPRRRLAALDEEEEEAYVPIDETFDYFKKAPEERWDCETVLSTYSNLDNHPTVLSAAAAKGARRRAGGGSASSVAASEPLHPAPIVLSRKTGLPVGVLNDARRQRAEHRDGGGSSSGDSDGDDGAPRVNRGEARARGETAEEKKARKARIKEERRLKRGEKAAIKAVFREGGKAEARVLGNAETANRRSVFAYS
ncbi:hypothetical protein JKP88DRAFT_353912 [Tribonema minus]|uniref:Protein LTV1 homolog n=1 Tax=Tribonema minus TaxID=303371 RepID=A0A836CIF2_9STRA|nr:hypothetical protein JKP88DRAFT_353912 [Tribonema minus]